MSSSCLSASVIRIIIIIAIENFSEQDWPSVGTVLLQQVQLRKKPAREKVSRRVTQGNVTT